MVLSQCQVPSYSVPYIGKLSFLFELTVKTCGSGAPSTPISDPDMFFSVSFKDTPGLGWAVPSCDTEGRE